MRRSLEVRTPGRGLHEIGDRVREIVAASGIREGIALVYVLHTSASLVVQENADPSARRDLEDFFDRLAPDGDPAYTHTAEGPDDMAAHLRASVTRTSEAFPVVAGELVMGTWQGLFLFEHRHAPHTRRLEIVVLGE